MVTFFWDVQIDLCNSCCRVHDHYLDKTRQPAIILPTLFSVKNHDFLFVFLRRWKIELLGLEGNDLVKENIHLLHIVLDLAHFFQ